MKYEAPKDGPYESGLTVRLIYDTVDALIKRHITHEDEQRVKEKYGGQLVKGKLWENPKVESELEEFVNTYFLGDLQKPQHFGEMASRGVFYIYENFGSYTAKLEGETGSKAKAKICASGTLRILEERYQRMLQQVEGLKSFEGEETIKLNASDAFRHKIFVTIALIEMLEDYIQSP